MKKLIGFIFILFFAQDASAQYYIDKNKEIVKKDIEKFFTKWKKKTTLSETDSSLKYTLLADSTTKPAEFNMYFNNEGICTVQESVSNCDSCLQIWLKNNLKDASYNWRKIGENSWFAKYKKQMAMQTKVVGDKYIITCTKFDLNRKAYKEIVYSKK
jgi:hypothetical protein